MQVCRKCRAQWPDSIIDTWGSTHETQGYGPEPKCTALVPHKQQPEANQVCGGGLAYWEDPEEKGQLLLLSPLGDDEARARAEKANARHTDALRNGR